ncbi:MAG: dUTP diphosphatase [Duncaniella sp.]|nr:dUTP diphosphatase [Bacteroides sp.]MDE5828135.1 dUTP diphosphatase [Duncaniella sp.]MDE6430349.1 dUTP diphosphatase [Duncaniella sp.]MDE6825024.1 dUTP diphosphatase [Duncaniella sp.]
MEHLKVKIINDSSNPLPAYETPSSAGMDVRAKLDAPVTLRPLERALIPTGLRMQLPQGYECQVRPRSGLALKHGISLVNTPGTIDADYRGEIGIIVINLSNEPYTITNGERIAQLVIKEYVHITWEQVDRIDTTVRGDGAFGHTGVN